MPPYNYVRPAIYQDQVLKTQINDLENLITGDIQVQINDVTIAASAPPAIVSAPQIAIGVGTGVSAQDIKTVAVGNFAGSINQNFGSVAVGFRAALQNQGPKSISIGWQSGGGDQPYAGDRRGNQIRDLSADEQADMDTFRQGGDAVALGNEAGGQVQNDNAIAVGAFAGRRGQGNGAIAIGFFTGELAQSEAAIAIGRGSAAEEQGHDSIAIGRDAGRNQQGSNAIALGQQAGLDQQAPRSIIINATGYAMNNVQGEDSDACFIKPIREQSETHDGIQILAYNAASGEVSRVSRAAMLHYLGLPT